MKLPSQRAAPAESPPQKLTTIFQFRNFRRDFTRQLDDIVGALNEQVFSFRTIGLLLQGEHHQVTEFVVKTPDLADDPDLKLHVEKARTRNGVTSFGAGPNFANNMLVFEVLHTYHTFDWSDLEMPMPIVGRCFLVAGEDKRVFPGPKFPMSHQLYGFESELEMGSTHDVAPNGKRLEFRAEFEQPSWILQEAYHRIVVPGMHVPSFLPLTLRIVDERCSDDRLKEPFHLTTIRVELQEFSCVPSKCLQSTEVRSQVLLEKKLFQEISMLNRHITIPVAMYDCVIPEVGPTFFTEGFIRTYGLKITVALSHKSGPSFNASAFVELNVAQEKYERIHEKDIFNPRSLGTEGTESYAQYFRVKLLQKFGPTDDSLLTFSRQHADESSGKFQRYSFLLHNNGVEGCFVILYDVMKKTRISRGKPKTKHCQTASLKIRQWLRSPTWKPSGFSGWTTRVIDLPTFGTNFKSGKPHVATCLVVNGQVIEANTPRDLMQETRSPYPTSPFSTERIPLSMVVSQKQSMVGSSDGTASPGMKLDEIVRCTFMVAQGFKDASQYIRKVKDTTITLLRIEIWLTEATYKDGEYFKNETILLDERRLRFIDWSDFQDAVAGSPNARAMTLPPGFLDCRIPIDTKPFVFGPKSFCRSHVLNGRFIVRHLLCIYSLEWSLNLHITRRDRVGH